MYVSACERMGPFIDVFLDGVRLADCKEADEKEGWVRVCIRDEVGRFCLTEDGRHVCTEIRYGMVQLRMRESAPSWAVEDYFERRWHHAPRVLE